MGRVKSQEARDKSDMLGSVVVMGVAVILALMPFHAFLTVWAASVFGHYTLWRLWKEILLIPIGLAAAWLGLRNERLRTEIAQSWLLRLMFAYVILQLLLGLVALKLHQVNRAALGEGLVEDVRLMVIFFVAWVAASQTSWLRDHWQKLLLIPAAIVVASGLLQAFVLPADFLAHFGYGPATIRPYELVDQNSQFVRVQSTLRGANPLGVYLVMIIAAISAFVGVKSKKQKVKSEKRDLRSAVIPAHARIQSRKRFTDPHLKTSSCRGRTLEKTGRFLVKSLDFSYFFPRFGLGRRVLRVKPGMTVGGLATLIVLYFTYSRSAYIGTALAVFGVAWLSIKNKRVKIWLLAAAAIVCVLAGGAALVLRHNADFEDTFFHTSQLSHSPHSSNQNRTSALESGIHDVLHDPFGRGPGTAGPASVHNNHPARIAENYFLQIGQEVGWLGLALFLTINILLAKELWHRRDEPDRLALTLIVSLAGLTFVNMLSHAWADDTLAYIWWGLAGIALADSQGAKTQKIK